MKELSKADRAMIDRIARNIACVCNYRAEDVKILIYETLKRMKKESEEE